MKINVISGKYPEPGCVIEIPYTESNVGNGPVFAVDPATRQSTNRLQRFEVEKSDTGNVTLKPVPFST